MIEDVYEPLARFRDEFRQKFAALARDKFVELARRAGVDVAANRALVKTIKSLRRQASSARTKKWICGLLIALGFVGAAAAAIGAATVGERSPEDMGWLVLLAVAGVILGIAMIPLFSNVSGALKAIERRIDAKMSEAWRQMEPMNRLYTWDLTPRLIEATVPRLAFDPYFTAARLDSLRSHFGWSDGFNNGKSITFAQSGEINGNPFVFGQYLDMQWGEKTYYGHKEISWTEWEEDSEGRRHRVTRYETLTASVTKPIPEYGEHKLLIYGNDAAPNLSFTHRPSGLTGAEGGLCGSIRKRWRLSRLKAYSRNLDDDSNFTLMSNQEFETWFHTKDRDNEVEFRLLFTPVAQTQMLALMKDTSVGYGDDFTFLKRKRINMLLSKHLDEATIDTDPSRFRNWDYDAAFAYFMKFNERYFKDAYFSLAPLLAIPLYQQTRMHEDIWKGVVGRDPSSFWEHEAIANYYGDASFRHPSSITRNILKTRLVRREGGESTVAVTAYGYCGEDRVDYESVYGGDGNWHDVAVHWTEYLPVERTSEMCLSEAGGETDEFRARAQAASARAFRRSILSFLKVQNA